MPPDAAPALPGVQVPLVEGRASWVAAGVSLAILSVAYGSTLLIVVGLRAMERGIDDRSRSLAAATARN